MKYLTLLFLVGCGSTPYVDVSLGYQFQEDYWLDNDRSWQCSKNLQFHLTPGLMFDWGRIELHHQSWLLCGGPFNHRPEVDTNDIRITTTWGGR